MRAVVAVVLPQAVAKAHTRLWSVTLKARAMVLPQAAARTIAMALVKNFN